MAFPRPVRRRVAPADDGGVPQTFDSQVSASADDAPQALDDSVDITGNMFSDHTAEHVGLRWTSVTIPAGATIDVVRVGTYIAHTAWDEPLHHIRGELDANAAAFTSTSDNVDSRSRTTAAVQWNSTGLGASVDELWEWGSTMAGEGNGANLKDIVQEVVDVGGWASGNALVMIWEQHTLDGTRDLYIRSWDQDNTRAAKLHVEFTA